MLQINICGRQIGLGQPAYLVAEIGINHNGDMDLARQTTLAAKESGADAVKLQNYRTEDFISDRGLTYRYHSQGQEVCESQFDMFKRCELNRQQLENLFEYAASIGIDIHSTPTNTDGIKALCDLGVGVLKNGSDYLTHLPLIQAMGETKLPTVLSTGMAVKQEIDDAVDTFTKTGNQKLLLLHCTSLYPTPADEVHLNKIRSLAKNYQCLSGFSDHSEGTQAAQLAVAMGAVWIEKHFTISRDLPGPDHHFSSDPDEFSQLVKQIRLVEQLLGKGGLGGSEAETEPRKQFRLSCAAARDLPTGHKLKKDDFVFQRPGSGLAPKFASQMYGKSLKSSLVAGQQFQWKDLK